MRLEVVSNLLLLTQTHLLDDRLMMNDQISDAFQNRPTLKDFAQINSTSTTTPVTAAAYGGGKLVLGLHCDCLHILCIYYKQKYCRLMGEENVHFDLSCIVCKLVLVYIYIYMYVYVFVCVCVFVCI